jgi:hypothetical protein
MALAVENEDIEALKAWGLGLEKVMERCFFCRSETRLLHRPSNKHVCDGCAEIHNEQELPSRIH